MLSATEDAIQMFTGFKLQLRACGGAVSCAGLLFLSGAVNAQDEVGEEEKRPDAGVEAIVVTGSRLVRSGYDTPTPVTTLGQEAINAQAPVDIGAFANTLPAISGSTTATIGAGSMATGNAGVAALNLRALGTARTLVLFDGRRSSVSTSSGRTDTNTMPQGLIERVEVVTGGASAAYGSGAVSGVVNFILDTDYTGVKSSLQVGETAYDDHENYKFTLTAGTPFADDRGHLLFNGEMSDVTGIHPRSNVRDPNDNPLYPPARRDWWSNGYHVMVNPDMSPGAPAFVFGDHIGVANQTPGGLIVSGPLQGTYFGVNGTVNQFAYGDVGANYMRGGDWQLDGMANTQSLAADEERESVFGRVSFALTADLEAFGEVSYAAFDGATNYLRVASTRVPIQRDNAYLPVEVAAAMDDAGIDSFLMSTTNADSAISGQNFTRENVRYTLGANGLFRVFGNDLDWDFYYASSTTDAHQQYLPGIYHLERMAMATDAVFHSSSGEIVCRSTLTDPGNGCVPLNRLGIGVSSREAWDYVTGAPLRDETFDMDVAAINFRTSELPGWAGPIGLAVGAEWRREGISGVVEDQFSQGWRFSNFQEDVGDYDVLEGYVETLIPVAENLSFNGAVRLSDYSTTGALTTWKAGLTFSPMDDITVRATSSRDIRSPNLGELFATGTARGNLIDIGGIIVPFQQKLQGSTRVNAEEATSYNLGFVLRPSFLPGLGASIDYYDIEVDGVIDFVGVTDVVRFCFDLDIQSYCDQLHFSDPGDVTSLTTVDLFYENLNRLKVRGIDVEASYELGLADIFDNGAGYLSFRLLASHFIEHVLDDGTIVRNTAGSNSFDTPDWKYRLTAMYTLEPWTMNLTARGVTEGVLRNTYIECTSNCPPSVFPAFTVSDNSVDGQLVFDAYLARRVNWGFSDASWEFFVAVDNLFDSDPPLVFDPSGVGSADQQGNPPTNLSLFDHLGRRFRLGVRVNWGDQ